MNSKVLLIEDDPQLCQLLTVAFIREGFIVWSAYDGEEGLAIARQKKPDLVILDIVIPKLEGMQLCQRLKESISTAHIPIIMMTGKREEMKDKLLAFEKGADDYILKPFDLMEIVARAKAILRRAWVERNRNPLTGLPGNLLVEEQIKKRLEADEIFAVLCCDIDNFKAYNDYYGHFKGDSLIKEVAKLMMEIVDEKEFVGHIGGDDFVIITVPERVEGIVQKIMEGIKTLSELFFEEEDKKCGFIQIGDRKGRKLQFPASLSITIACCTNMHRRFSSPVQIQDVLTELRAYGKGRGGGCFVVDRRRH